MTEQNELKLPALEIVQGRNRIFYSFAVDGKLLPKFATVSRIRRDGDDLVAGYQRPEVFSHISEIRNYIESKDPLLPNAIVLAFDRPGKVRPAERWFVFVQSLGNAHHPAYRWRRPEEETGTHC